MTLSSLYSAFVIDPRWDVSKHWPLFTYQVSQPVVATAHDVIATRAHTNIPRSGEWGLPMGWDALIDQWRAVTSIRFAEPVLEWASQCHATLRYNDKIVDRRPLLDLLFSAHGTFDPDQRRVHATELGVLAAPRSPLWIRENLSYGVEVQANVGVTEKLQRWLVEHTSDYRLITWIFLEGIVHPSVY